MNGIGLPVLKRESRCCSGSSIHTRCAIHAGLRFDQARRKSWKLVVAIHYFFQYWIPTNWILGDTSRM